MFEVAFVPVIENLSDDIRKYDVHLIRVRHIIIAFIVGVKLGLLMSNYKKLTCLFIK